jgi:xanthine/uracil/vitamin C permease (AzgA family)
MAISKWQSSRALRLGATCGLVITALTALDARSWVLGPLPSFIIQTLAGGIGGAFVFWLAAVVRNRLVR